MHIQQINKLLSLYKESAKEIKEPEWYSKGVALYFTFDDDEYVLHPKDIDATGEVFEMLENRIADDLYAIGAYDIYCTGMLD